MRVTPETAGHGDRAEHGREERNFRLWMFDVMMGRSPTLWDWELWKTEWDRCSEEEKMALCVRYEIECESGRYV